MKVNQYPDNLPALVSLYPDNSDLGKVIRSLVENNKPKPETYCFACDALERGLFLYPNIQHTCKTT